MLIRPIYRPRLPSLALGLIHWWPFDDGIGIAGNVVSPTAFGTRTGTTFPSVGITQSVNGAQPGAVKGDGSTGYINVSSPISNLSAMSLAIWLNVSSWSVNDYTVIFGFADAPTIYVKTTGVPAWYANAGSSDPAGSTAVPLNQWVHLAWTAVDGGNAITYINGVQVASSAITTISGGAGALKIGAVPAQGARYIHGSFDDARIYNRVLSPAEILALAMEPFQPQIDIETIALEREPIIVPSPIVPIPDLGHAPVPPHGPEWWHEVNLAPGLLTQPGLTLQVQPKDFYRHPPVPPHGPEWWHEVNLAPGLLTQPGLNLLVIPHDWNTEPKVPKVGTPSEFIFPNTALLTTFNPTLDEISEWRNPFGFRNPPVSWRFPDPIFPNVTLSNPTADELTGFRHPFGFRNPPVSWRIQDWYWQNYSVDLQASVLVGPYDQNEYIVQYRHPPQSWRFPDPIFPNVLIRNPLPTALQLTTRPYDFYERFIPPQHSIEFIFPNGYLLKTIPGPTPVPPALFIRNAAAVLQDVRQGKATLTAVRQSGYALEQVRATPSKLDK